VQDEIRIHIIENVMPLLERSVNSFYSVLSKAELVGVQEKVQPRFVEPHSGHFMLLMAVKSVSTLNAIICLIKAGYVQEVGILYRVLIECNAKILCIEEAHTKGVLNAEQKKIVDDYFENDIRSAEDIINGNNWWVDMKKVNASQARFLSEGTGNKDVHTIRTHIQTIYDAFSGYVHGLYSHIMELNDVNTGTFTLKGCSPRVDGMLDVVSSGVLQTLNTFSQIALRLGLSELKKELIYNRDVFIKSEAYCG